MPLDFRILGPLEVRVDGRSITLGGARQRAVLAILLLHRGEVVSVDRIVDELWGDQAPETASKTVQVYVSRLRKLLGENAVITRGGGYVVEPASDTVDADRFERLAREGRDLLERDPDDAAQRLCGALEIWRGPPLADLAYESFAQAEIGRLEELRLGALEDRIEADLARSHHAQLVPELETLVAANPTRERLRGQLMLALYRSGRQSEALDSYRDARRVLGDELGLEPGPELKRLEHAILNQDPEIAAQARRRSADEPRRRRGGMLIAFGGGLLLAAAIAAVLAAGNDGSEPVEPNSLAVIDPSSNELVATVPTGVDPGTLTADQENVWVGNEGDDTVSQINAASRKVAGTIPAKTTVGGLAAGAGAVWIGGSGSKLIRLDPEFRSTKAIPLAPEPESGAGAVAVGDGDVWVAGVAGGAARVDPRSDEVVGRFPVGNNPSSVATGLGGVWITDDVDNSLTRLDPANATVVTATTPVGQGPAAVAVGEGAVWVANTLDDTVSRVDPETGAVTDTIAVAPRPTGIAAGEGAVWVASSLAGVVSRIDPESSEVEATIAVGAAPQAVTVAHGHVWVSVRASVTAPEPPASGAADDVARVLLPSDPGPADPALAGGPLASQLFGATCALLYNYPDRPYPVGAHPIPEVASGPPAVSDDGLTYTFTLREGFRFSPPSNEPLTAAAFKRAVERGKHPAMGSYATLVADFASVKANGQTLIIRLKEPSTNLIDRLATPWFCAVPPDTPIREGGVDALPSAGPYYVASHSPDQSLVLRRNPNYGGERPQGLEEIRFEFGVTPEEGVQEVEAGRADYVILDPPGEPGEPVDSEAFGELAARYGPRSEAAAAGRQQLFTQPSLVLYYFVFNPQRGPFTDLRLRKAVSYAMDRRALAAHTGLDQRGRPTDQYIPPGAPGFEDVTVYPLTGPDLATARRLAGGERRRALLYTCDLPDCTRHAEILRANLAAIGIELDVRQFPLEEFFTRIQRPGEPWDIAFWAWVFDYADPATFINDQFGPSAQTPMAVHDPGVVSQMEDAANRTGEDRLRAYAELDRDLATNTLPSAPFAAGTVSHFLSARMGCQILQPVYSLDLAALCVRDDGE